MYLLDTNHCSLILLENSIIFDCVERVGESNISTTIVTVGELMFMAENSKYREQNLTRVEEFLADIRVYYVDEKTAKIYGQIKPEFLTKSAIAKHRSLTGSGFEQSD
ncbi:MAG: type II toxin-antitoxin system VapC family toxin, partial [Crocosphaera sp.]|uniref:type II toxin-antitoxin system VapC family toxin n=1 Tax=Crocosphaera sp. TaxID=2729996 RepID=UPI002583C259